MSRDSGEGVGASGMKLDYAPPGRITFSEKFACPVSGFTIAEIEPRLFSFNAPQGACPACDGLGEKLLFDPELVVPNENLSIKKGAVVPWAKSNPPSPYYMQVLGSLAREFGFDLNTPWNDLSDEVHDIILKKWSRFALYALEHHRGRIAQDHAAAKTLARELRAVGSVVVGEPETNIVNLDTPRVPSDRVIDAARKRVDRGDGPPLLARQHHDPVREVARAAARETLDLGISLICSHRGHGVHRA